MNKKTRYLIALLFAVSLSPSCEKWLDIEPQYEITDTDLYKNAAGYYKAVNGLYFQLASLSLYGKELSWGMADVWARYYYVDPASDFEAYPQIFDLQYEGEELSDIAASIWSGGYKIIAQANDLIAHAEAVDAEFFPLEEVDRNTILGEAYAVRAMMHLDLMRVFGASMAVDPEGSYVPYVDSYPSTVNPPIPSREYMTRVIDDLKRAYGLLKTFDVETNPAYATSTVYRFSSTNVPDQGKFFCMRGTRLNYYAVTILLARAYLWAGEPDQALIYAQEIIDLVTAKTLSLITSQGTISTDPKLFDEVLFGYYNEDLMDTYEPYANATNSQRLTIDDKSFFNTPTSDYRKYFLSGNFMQKYTKENTTEKDCIIPGIRLSEAYYIAAECLYKTDMTTAAADLMTIRKKRGYSSPALSGTTTEEEFWEALTYEYRKEFIGEGQLLFFFKRTNRPITYSGGNFNHAGKLVMPIPDSESAI